MNILPTRLQRSATSTRQAPPVQRTNPSTQQGPIVLREASIHALKPIAQRQTTTPVEVSSHGLGGNRQSSVQACNIGSFTSNEAKVGLAIALQHSHDARDRSQVLRANQLQDMFPNKFTKHTADQLVTLLKKAHVHLKRDPLFGEGDEGLIFSVKGRTKSLAAHKLNSGKAKRQKDIEQIVGILRQQGIQPKLYTGHKIGGELAHFAHKKMGGTGAITISFDSKPQALSQSSTPELSSINVAIDKKARDLGHYIQQHGFDSLRKNATRETPVDQPGQQQAEPVSVSHPTSTIMPVATSPSIRSRSDSGSSGFHSVNSGSGSLPSIQPESPLTSDDDAYFSANEEEPKAIPASSPESRIQFLAQEKLTERQSSIPSKLKELSLLEVYRSDPKHLITEMGHRPQEFSTTELLTLTDLPGAKGHPADYQALSLHYLGQLYNTLNQGPKGMEKFWDQLFTAPEIKQILGERSAAKLCQQAKTQFKQVDTALFKRMLELEIRREAQASAFEQRSTTLANQARPKQAQETLAKEALDLYQETGYLRLLTLNGRGTGHGHATCLTLEKVQTDQGEENLAVLFDSGNHALRGRLKKPQTPTEKAKYQAQPQAYIGVEFTTDHLVNLIKGRHNKNQEGLDSRVHASRFTTLTANDISANLANQEGARAVDLQELPLDQGQKNGSCAIKSVQAPAKEKFPFLISLMKVMRLKDTLQDISKQQTSASRPWRTAKNPEQLSSIQNRAQQQLATHTRKMMAMLDSGKAISGNAIIEQGRAPRPLPTTVQNLAQQAGDIEGNRFKAKPYQRNNLEQITRLQQLAADHSTSNTPVLQLQNALASLAAQALKNQKYLKQSRFDAATPEYHHQVRNDCSHLANELLKKCKNKPVAVQVNMDNQPGIMLMQRSTNKPTEMAKHNLHVKLLSPNLAQAYKSLGLDQADEQPQGPGVISFEVFDYVLSAYQDDYPLRDLVFGASTANNHAPSQGQTESTFNQALRFSYFGGDIGDRRAQGIKSEAIGDLPTKAPTGLLLMDMLSQQVLGKDSDDYQQIFGRYQQELKKEATNLANTMERRDAHYASVVALGDSLKASS